MSDLTEVEIFSCMQDSFKVAAQCCRQLAEFPSAGPSYTLLRKSLKLIEGCCRQAAHWREDSRWLGLGLTMEEAHQRAGHWLRRHYPRPLFLKLAENLEAGYVLADQLKNQKTGRTGAILPDMPPPPDEVRNLHPVSLPSVPAATEARKTKSGLIIPAGTSV